MTPASSLTALLRVSTAPQTMVALTTTYLVVAGTAGTYTHFTEALTTISPLPAEDTTSVIEYYFGSIDTSDVAYYLSSLNTSVSESTTGNIPIDLTCSLAGSTSITYALAPYGAEAVPTWVTLDTTNQQLVVNTPSVTVDTEYRFTVTSTFSGDTYGKEVYITVTNTGTVVVPPPGPTDPTDDDNDSEDDSTETTEQKSELGLFTDTIADQTTVTVFLCAGIIGGIISNFGGVYSPQRIWSVLNQFQLYLLIGLLVESLPYDILKLFNSMGIALIDYRFLRSMDLLGYSTVKSYFDCQQGDEYLDLIGLESEWSTVNNFQILVTSLAFVIPHLIVLLLLKIFKSNKGWLGKLLTKLFKMLTFTTYLRMFIEAYLVLYLSATSEIKNFKFSNFHYIISFGFSCLIIIVAAALVILSYFYGK